MVFKKSLAETVEFDSVLSVFSNRMGNNFQVLCREKAFKLSEADFIHPQSSRADVKGTF